MNLQMEINSLKQRIAELEQQSKQEQEFPQDGDVYWLINTAGETNWVRWHGAEIENKRLSFGNVFKTKEEADFALEKLKVEAELRKFSRPFIYGEYNRYIFFHIDGDDLEVGYKVSTPSQGTIYFESEEKAKQAIQSIGEERIKKYIFGVED